MKLWFEAQEVLKRVNNGYEELGAESTYAQSVVFWDVHVIVNFIVVSMMTKLIKKNNHDHHSGRKMLKLIKKQNYKFSLLKNIQMLRASSKKLKFMKTHIWSCTLIVLIFYL